MNNYDIVPITMTAAVVVVLCFFIGAIAWATVDYNARVERISTTCIQSGKAWMLVPNTTNFECAEAH